MWSVYFTGKAAKAVKKLPKNVRHAVAALVAELRVSGPVLHGKGWRNFGKLKGRANEYHCHVKSGRPTYVVCWSVADSAEKSIEVNYVGTHEKAPY